MMWKPIHWGAIFVLAGFFLGVNWTTAAYYPSWSDDVMQIDAGVNLALGRGWSSTAWMSQSRWQFWAANNPLFPLLLSGWIEVFGFSLHVVRAFGYALAIISTAVIVDATWRARWITSPWVGILLGLLVLCDFGLVIVYRSGRADVLAMLVVAMLVRAWLTLQDRESRRWQVFVISLFLIPSGLQTVPYVAILILCDAVLYCRFRTSDALAAFGGCAIGGAFSLALFASQGQAYAFLSQTVASGYNIFGAGLQAVVIGDTEAVARFVRMLHELLPGNVLKTIAMNPSLPALILALLAVWSFSLIYRRREIAMISLAGVFVAVSVVFGMLLAGRFAIYYSWMASIPAAIGVVTSLQKLIDGRFRMGAAALVVVVALAIALGLPRQLVVEARGDKAHITSLVESIVAAEVSGNAVVYGDPALYYAVKGRGLDFYSVTYAGGRGYREMSKSERDSITLLIVYSGDEFAAMTKLGGKWALQRTYSVRTGPGNFRGDFLVFRRA